MKANLHLIGSTTEPTNEEQDNNSRNTHTFFVDSEKDVAAFDPVKQFGTHASLLSRTYNRPKIEDLKSNNKL